MTISSRFLRFDDPPIFALDGPLHSIRAAAAHCNFLHMIGRDIQLPGDSGINAPKAGSLLEFGSNLVRIHRDKQPHCEIKNNSKLHNESRGICVPTKKSTENVVATQIQALRARLGISQTGFAMRLGTRPSTISKWESGDSKPSPELFVRIARLCEGPEKMFFLDQAGVPEGFFEGRPMLSEMVDASTEIIARTFGAGDLSQRSTEGIPLLKDPVAAGTPQAIDEKNIEGHLHLPRSWFPRNSEMYALHVVGDSMSPIIEDGYIVFVDAAQREPRLLVDRMVAAREGTGVTIKWLRKDGDIYFLIPQHVSPRHQVRVVRPEGDFSIVGVVVKWIGQPAPVRR